MSGKGSYPTQSYPTQGYPTQGYPASGYPQQQYPQPGYNSSVMYAQPSPGVSVTHVAQSYSSPNAYAAPPNEPPPPYSYAAPGQPIQYQQQQLHGGYPMQQGFPGQTVVVPNAFDSGARFDGIAQPNIPPPPPGVSPNAAQMAGMQGHTVMGTQQKSSFWTGGSGGGYTWGGL